MIGENRSIAKSRGREGKGLRLLIEDHELSGGSMQSIGTEKGEQDSRAGDIKKSNNCMNATTPTGV